MPQCGQLRSMGVCGFEPTDPPPYRPRPEGRFVRFIRSAARLIETFGRAFCREALSSRRDKSVSKKKDQGDGLECDSGMIQTAGPEAGRHPQLSVANEAVVPAGKIGRGEVTASTRFRAGRTNLVQGRTRGHLLWSMFQALRQGPVQYTDCFSWRERGKLCGVARRNEEEMRRDRPHARPFRGQ